VGQADDGTVRETLVPDVEAAVLKTIFDVPYLFFVCPLNVEIKKRTCTMLFMNIIYL
jgi:hypothetical protein